jgi:hypothetical protein
MVAARAAALAVVTGAGISGADPAGLPLGNQLRNDVLRGCHAAARRVAGHLVSDADLDELLRSSWKLEVVIGRIAGTVGDIAIDCLRALDLVLPNEAHMLAAVHLAHGGLHVTLNFDEGIELAHDLLIGMRPLPSDTPAALVAALPAWRALLPSAPARCRVVASEQEFLAWRQDGCPPALLKVHGSLRTTSAGLQLVDPVVVDELELAQLSPPRRAALAAVARTSRVLVTGYAGEDIDVYAPLLDELDATAFSWVSVGFRVGSPVPGDVTARFGQLHQGVPDGLATTALRAHLGLSAEYPPWPELPVQGPGYSTRLASWAARLHVSTRPEDLAEAYAWMLADAGDYARAYRLLRYLVDEAPSRSGHQLAGRPRLRLLSRLADVEYDRNAPGDKPRARQRWLRVALAPAAGLPLRGYALLRLGETYRQVAFRGPVLLRPLALAAAAAAPTLALVVSGRGSRGAVTAARAYSALVGLGLRMLEVAPGVEYRWPRGGLILIARIVTGWGEQALRLGPGGNRQAFVLQQHAEINLLAAIYRGKPPTPHLVQKLSLLRDSYRNGGDLRGVANTTAALALAEVAAGNHRQAEQLLLDAEQAYADARPGQPPDPSGIALVTRRRHLLQRLAGASTRPARRSS